MTPLEELTPGTSIRGIVPDGLVTVVSVHRRRPGSLDGAVSQLPSGRQPTGTTNRLQQRIHLAPVVIGECSTASRLRADDEEVASDAASLSRQPILLGDPPHDRV